MAVPLLSASLQAHKESPGELSFYAINTVQVSGQEKYLIVSPMEQETGALEDGLAAFSAMGREQQGFLGILEMSQWKWS